MDRRRMYRHAVVRSASAVFPCLSAAGPGLPADPRVQRSMAELPSRNTLPASRRRPARPSLPTVDSIRLCDYILLSLITQTPREELSPRLISRRLIRSRKWFNACRNWVNFTVPVSLKCVPKYTLELIVGESLRALIIILDVAVFNWRRTSTLRFKK